MLKKEINMEIEKKSLKTWGKWHIYILGSFLSFNQYYFHYYRFKATFGHRHVM